MLLILCPIINILKDIWRIVVAVPNLKSFPNNRIWQYTNLNLFMMGYGSYINFLGTIRDTDCYTNTGLHTL